MHLTATDIQAIHKTQRINIINSITGIKPANLIGTRSKTGVTNLAIFSSVVHLGSNPALLAFVMRPAGEVERHTYENIKATGVYTINHVHKSFIEQAHHTSAKFEREESEFVHCGFTEEYLSGFDAPFVKESKLRMGMRLKEEMPIALNNTILLIGEVAHIFLPEEAMSDEGNLDLSTLGTAGISGLNSYYGVEKLASFPMATTDEIKKQRQEM